MEKINIFGYGSLLWDPQKDSKNCIKATLHGWHRVYNIRSTKSRGTIENPGIVLGLEKGGICEGIIYQIPKDQFQSYKKREGVSKGVYLLKSVKKNGLKITNQGKEFAEDCYTVVTNKKNKAYLNLTVDEKVKMAVKSTLAGGGQKGTSFEYIKKTYLAFKELGIEDKQLKIMYEKVKNALNEK